VNTTFWKIEFDLFARVDKKYSGRMKNPVSVVLISLFLALCLKGPSLAQDGIKMGRVTIHPSVSFSAKYNDNVFLSADKVFANGRQEVAQSDYIFTINPSLAIGQTREKGDNFGFMLDYSVEDERFAELEGQDFFNQSVLGQFEFGDVAGKKTLIIGGQYLDTRIPVSTEFSASFNPRSARSKYEVNSTLKWLLANDLYIKIKGQFSRNLFDENRLDDQEFQNTQASGILFWQTTAITGFGINYSYSFIDFLKNRGINFDAVRQSTSLIWRWEPLSVFNSEVQIGYHHSEFEGVLGQDRDDLIYKVAFKYRPKSTREWTLIGVREIPNSFFNDIQAFEKTEVNLGVDQQIGVKWMIRSQISYQIHQYDIPAVDVTGGGAIKLRKDEYFSGLLSLIYSIQDWIDVIAEYNYVINNSNFDNVDYLNNIALIRLSILF
jgi:hypothetical protein